jgi:HEAT repeat protein
MRVDTDSWYGTIYDATRQSACESGPVRVVVARADGDVVRVESYVGPAIVAPGAADLGRAAPAEAAAWLGRLARSADGRPARDALVALGVMDSAAISPALLELTRDADRPRDLRRSALGWLLRRRTAADGLPTAELVRLVATLARDEGEHASFRQSVVGYLSRFERGEGIPTLVEFSRGSDAWLARHAVEVLGRSGDPRARAVVRDLVARDGTTPELRAVAIQALGGEYGTARDADALIQAWPRLTSDRVREAALSTIASIGGKDARSFMMRVVGDEQGEARPRRRAASLLDRMGVPMREIVQLYDRVSDGEIRGQLIDAMAQAGTTEARTKLLKIAKEDTQVAARRRAISALGKSEDPAVRAALKELIS